MVKKIFKTLLLTSVLFASMLTFVACGGESATVTVYEDDKISSIYFGAPTNAYAVFYEGVILGVLDGFNAFNDEGIPALSEQKNSDVKTLSFSLIVFDSFMANANAQEVSIEIDGAKLSYTEQSSVNYLVPQAISNAADDYRQSKKYSYNSTNYKDSVVLKIVVTLNSVA